MENNENCIEWVTGQHTITCTISQKRFITKLENLAKKHPDKVKILSRNDDGTILARLPIKALKLSVIERELSDEDRQLRAERMRKIKEEN